MNLPVDRQDIQTVESWVLGSLVVTIPLELRSCHHNLHPIQNGDILAPVYHLRSTCKITITFYRMQIPYPTCLCRSQSRHIYGSNERVAGANYSWATWEGASLNTQMITARAPSFSNAFLL